MAPALSKHGSVRTAPLCAESTAPFMAGQPRHGAGPGACFPIAGVCCSLFIFLLKQQRLRRGIDAGNVAKPSLNCTSRGFSAKPFPEPGMSGRLKSLPKASASPAKRAGADPG